MKYFLISILICCSLITKATPSDSLKRRKHFAIEADVAYANARINPITPSLNVLKATFKAPNFMCYNLAFVYNIRGVKRDCSDPVHDLSFAGGASFMKMNVEQTMQNYRVIGTNSYSDVSFATQKINYTYSPIEVCLLLRYTYSTRKFFASFNAGVSRVLLDDTKYTAVQNNRNTVATNSNGTTTENINSTSIVGHYLVPNNSTNNILGVRFGYNGKRISPYITIQRHGATAYTYFKAGLGAMLYF